MEIIKDGQSSTEEPNTHTFAVGDKLFTIIDTPGIVDFDQEEKDREDSESILSHLSQEIQEIQCICILLKPNKARLVFSLISQQVTTHLGNDAARNIVICFTHASFDVVDQAEHTLLPALQQELYDQEVELELDQSNVFFFDNGALRFLACVKDGIEFPEIMFDAC